MECINYVHIEKHTMHILHVIQLNCADMIGIIKMEEEVRSCKACGKLIKKTHTINKQCKQTI
jgi:hypothetical protein